MGRIVRTPRLLGVIFLGSVLLATRPPSANPSPTSPTGAMQLGGTLTIKQIAVRQGDAAVIQGPCGELGLIDTNRFREQEVLDVLDDDFGTRTLEWVAVSHYDADHLGGILGVVTADGASAERAYDRGGDENAHDTDTYRNYFDWATSPQTMRVPVDIGDSFTLCTGAETVTFEVVSAGTDGTAAGGVEVTEENDKGVCLKLTYVNFDFATCGDINGTDEGSRTDVESAVAQALGEVDFAKVNHHGSPFSSNQTYVDTLSPEAVVVSVGANGFGHPDPAVLARWDAIGDVFQTQDDNNDPVDGTITVTTDGQTMFTLTTSGPGITRSYSVDDSARCPGYEDVAGNHIVGTNGPEVLDGTADKDIICGLRGSDEIAGAGSRDVLIGGAGVDEMLGGGSNDRLLGNRGNDDLDGGPGRDRCRGGEGKDFFTRCEVRS
jgi:beta-lactamase superfamily II metal-dependent hydrolase